MVLLLCMHRALHMPCITLPCGTFGTTIQQLFTVFMANIPITTLQLSIDTLFIVRLIHSISYINTLINRVHCHNQLVFWNSLLCGLAKFVLETLSGQRQTNSIHTFRPPPEIPEKSGFVGRKPFASVGDLPPLPPRNTLVCVDKIVCN